MGLIARWLIAKRSQKWRVCLNCDFKSNIFISICHKNMLQKHFFGFQRLTAIQIADFSSCWTNKYFSYAKKIRF